VNKERSLEHVLSWLQISDEKEDFQSGSSILAGSPGGHQRGKHTTVGGFKPYEAWFSLAKRYVWEGVRWTP